MDSSTRARRKKIVLLSDVGELDLERRELGRVAAFEVMPCRTEEDVARNAADADVVLTAFAPLTRRAIGKLPNCGLIAAYSTGTDAIDVEAATEHGIVVTNAGDYCAEEVAEHAIALILCLVRRVTVLDSMAKRGEWERASAIQDSASTPSFLASVPRLTSLTLGVLGFGRTGRRVAEMASGLGLEVLAYDPYVPRKVMAESGARPAEFRQLLAESDIVSLHLSLTAETRDLIGPAEISLMKRGSYLVNTSRAALVDEDSLVDAIRSGRLAGAALDVMWKEPPDPAHPLLRMDNVIVTPHRAFYSLESIKRLHERVVGQVLAFLRGEMPPFAVNPEAFPRAVGKVCAGTA